MTDQSFPGFDAMVRRVGQRGRGPVAQPEAEPELPRRSTVYLDSGARELSSPLVERSFAADFNEMVRSAREHYASGARGARLQYGHWRACLISRHDFTKPPQMRRFRRSIAFP